VRVKYSYVGFVCSVVRVMASANTKQLRDNLANYDAQLDQVRTKA